MGSWSGEKSGFSPKKMWNSPTIGIQATVIKKELEFAQQKLRYLRSMKMNE
jgi:hypothetical protein